MSERIEALLTRNATEVLNLLVNYSTSDGITYLDPYNDSVHCEAHAASFHMLDFMAYGAFKISNNWHSSGPHSI